MLKTVSSFVNSIGALNYKGTWNASTNVNPTLTSGAGTKGDYYVVSVAGSTNIDGQNIWGVGDWIVFNGSVWQRVDGGSTGNFTTVDASSTITGASLIPSGTSIPVNGVFLPAANTVAFSTNTTERSRVTSAGNLLLGTATDGAGLGVSRLAIQSAGFNDAICAATPTSAYSCMNAWNQATSGDNNFIAFWTEDLSTIALRGSINYNRTGGLVAYNTMSDYRAKDIIGPVENSGSIIDALKVYNGKIKGAEVERPMFIAHELQEITPYAVTGTKDAINDEGKPVFQQVDVSSLIPLLISEIQSLRFRLAKIENEQNIRE